MTMCISAPTAGRQSNGQFAKGNPGGPGNPNLRHAAMMRAAALQSVTVEDISAIMRMLIDRARDGDREAGRLVLSYTLGKPVAAPVDMDMMKEVYREMESIAAAAPSIAPAVAPTIAPVAPAMPQARSSATGEMLARRESHVPSMEELLGITPPPSPFGNGGNGGAGAVVGRNDARGAGKAPNAGPTKKK